MPWDQSSTVSGSGQRVRWSRMRSSVSSSSGTSTRNGRTSLVMAAKVVQAPSHRPTCTTVTPMPDYDAIVIGAGHNGLTAAAVMARGGMRVLCLEKNHFIGGMASSTELIRGYHFELAGSIQFPLPNEIYEDLGFD